MVVCLSILTTLLVLIFLDCWMQRRAPNARALVIYLVLGLILIAVAAIAFSNWKPAW